MYKFKTIAPTLDLAPYANGDLLADRTEIENIRRPGKTPVLRCIKVADRDNQGQPFDVILTSTNASLGNLNDPPSINHDDIIAIIPVLAADLKTIGSEKFGNVACEVPVSIASSSDSIWAGLISRGTGSYSVSGLHIEFVFEYR